MTAAWRRLSDFHDHGDGIPRYTNQSLLKYRQSVSPLNRREDAVTPVKPVLIETGMAMRALDHARMALREYVYEDIRRSEFEFRPSRQTCLFLCPERPECVNYWWSALDPCGTFGKIIYEVEATGNWFVARAETLTLNTKSVEALEDDARNYWSTESVGFPDDEVLLVGEIRVVAERCRSDFGL